MNVYEQRLSAFQAVDFDDLIGLPLKLLQRDDEARAKWQQQFHHILVDEYQDTNAVQYELLKALVEHPGRATAWAVHGRGRRRPENLRLARRELAAKSAATQATVDAASAAD